MKKAAVETSVGIFVLIGLICIAYLTIKLGKMELLGDNYYFISAEFGSVSGLKEGASVDLSGVQIGQVTRIELDKETFVAVVEMKINAKVPVDEEAIASVKTSGLIGDKYIRIEPGGGEKQLKDGDMLFETESAIDMEEMMSKYAFGGV